MTLASGRDKFERRNVISMKEGVGGVLMKENDFLLFLFSYRILLTCAIRE